MKSIERESGLKLSGSSPAGLVPKMLNHAAYVTHDTAVTVDFYTRVLGMELACSVLDDVIPSTGDPFPFLHTFFRIADGSTLAFFESPGLPPRAQPTHPAYSIFEHIALEVSSVEELHRWHAWLLENGVSVIGPTNHDRLILSIYFHDPNGYRLELTVPIDPSWNMHTDQAYQNVQLWTQTKRSAQEAGGDPTEALVKVIKAAREQRAKAG
ncbi:MAG: Glyoxalase/bleomycin resistance protein/dioxygenase [Ramlibacter sp.]|jgi:catechol 2,3-dioxygenase-like lactoylglutathione lyase family enzyme|nr:Glyoxalase/bleomycin resistance protein/dioxygenase [Ramlibacter sp.]